MKTLATAFVLLLITGLAACGGGGSGGGGVPASVVAAVAVPVATPVPATVATPDPVRDCTVDLYGDSVLHGQNGAGLLAETPAQFIKRTRPAYTVKDWAVDGAGIYQQLPFMLPVTFGDARFAVLEWGIADSLAGYTDIATPYRTVIANVQLAHKTPVVTGIVSSFNKPDIAAQPKAVAKDLSVYYAGWDAVAITTVDGLHPDQTSSNVLAGKIIEVLDLLAPECIK